MNKVPNLSPLAGHQAAATVDVSSAAARHRAWYELLRPQFVEKAVLSADFVLIVAISLACSSAYHWTIGGDIALVPAFIGVGIFVAANFTVIMAARQNYRIKNLGAFTRQARDAAVVWCGVYGLLAVVGFTMKISTEVSRGSSILFFFGGLAAFLMWRLLVTNFISHSLANGSFATKKVVVIAERDLIVSSRSLIELRRYGYHSVKTCEVSKEEVARIGVAGSLRAKLADVIEVARSERIDDIYLLIGWHHHRIIDGILDALAVLPISVHLVPDESAARFLDSPIANIGTTWTAELKRAPLTRGELAAKRCFDVVLSGIGLVTLLPLLLITALLIKLDSRGPVFFLQKRNGFNGHAFNIFKFRTMHVLEDSPVVRQATRDDPRVTRLGHWLRRSSIDELPQLFNVLRGEMSLVGPRPHAASHNSGYEKLIANYAFRHHVKPGLTGWAQVKGYRGETPKIEQMERRVEHDLWYINNWSPWLDISIILRTTVVMLRQRMAY
jgi:Undecaprenyl-phosphate glucose phosphotransferase